MRRLLAILLLMLLPLQFSWAAVASYCGHETEVGVKHLGHHDHQHHAEASDGVVLDANSDAGESKVPGAMDLDCGHCHGTCSFVLNLPPALHGARATAPPSAILDEAGGARAPARPERPQWRPLA